MILAPGQVAVVTGAASGIGFALTRELLDRGLSVVMADVEKSALDSAAEELRESGVPDPSIITAVVDVSDGPHLQELAVAVMERFGRIDLLMNNAGVVGPRRPLWEQNEADVDWIRAVNLDGVTNGIRAFVPLMVAAGSGHVVNTSSVAALTVIGGGGNGPYAASKHAVVGLSEVLQEDLRSAGVAVGVSVLCPGPVQTRIRDAARNRPLRSDAPATGAPTFVHTVATISADEAATRTLAAVEAGRFWILTNAGNITEARERLRKIAADLDSEELSV
ncbi:SDR family NAD(P)-dependent oxidoreductase [Rhodococcus fascians]|nr:SDR family NAD(P)-dependent oxidoreductase [Rhodococcus fascians]MBY4238740.1 SDR family NAD(P)-dependent oxidoreductase [Rhodococcus fascians]MBY4254671.1 SDR family NAD(P)-dependent oxidoreductase [Rhodococcus fascians]MBY4270095.1 SDR family NAD(P)-dependent oxidoreductase [Rhodococcus fascians]